MFCEAFIRLWILGQQEYFCGIESNWNYFDLFLLVTSIVDVCMTLITDASAESPTQLLRAFRLARLTRMFKVFRLKFIKELQLMVKGLLGGLRTLVCAFALLFVVLYIIAVFATFTIGRAPDLDGNLQILFRSVPSTMFTAFRCYSGECITEEGFPVALLLSENDQFGMIFVLLYVAGYMLVTMGIYNVILAVYVDITMKAARENEARTSEQHERESIRAARGACQMPSSLAAYAESQEDRVSQWTPPNPRSKVASEGPDEVLAQLSATAQPLAVAHPLLQLQDGDTFKQIGNAFQVKGELANVDDLKKAIDPSLPPIQTKKSRESCLHLHPARPRLRQRHRVIFQHRSNVPNQAWPWPQLQRMLQSMLVQNLSVPVQALEARQCDASAPCGKNALPPMTQQASSHVSPKKPLTLAKHTSSEKASSAAPQAAPSASREEAKPKMLAKQASQSSRAQQPSAKTG
eukprot:g30218.t1